MIIVHPARRRSVSYMPGSNARAIAKAQFAFRPARSSSTSEDSVAPDARARRRAHQVMEAGRGRRFRAARGRGRINGLLTTSGLAPTTSMRPPRRSPMRCWCRRWSKPGAARRRGSAPLDISADHTIRIWAMMETPAFAMLQIAAHGSGGAANDAETRLDVFRSWAPTTSPRRRARVFFPAARRCCLG